MVVSDMFLLCVILCAVFGLCIGSFINVVICRLPKGGLFSKPRSHCPACGEQLSWRDLIPVFSYIMLKGYCRYCGKKISMRYPVIECTCALLAVVSVLRFGFEFSAVLTFAISVNLLAITVIDFDTMEIPNSLNISLIPLAVCAMFFFEIPLLERVIGFFVISLPMVLISLAINNAFGGGDIKLMAVCGFLLGWKWIILAFAFANLIGGIYAGYLLASRKAKRGTHIPYGPYLCAGIAISLFGGEQIFLFYLRLFL